MLSTFPAGIVSFLPAPYGERRWNGAVWPTVQTDAYNSQLTLIESHHGAGMNVTALVDGLYNLANGFDQANKPVPATYRVEVRHNGVAFLAGNWDGTPSASGGMFHGLNLLTGEKVRTGLAINVTGRTFHTL